MAQLQPRVTLLDLPLEVRLKVWKIAVHDSQPEELDVCNHENLSQDPDRDFNIPVNPELRLRLITKGINSELDLLNSKHSTKLPCRDICNDNLAPGLIFCHGSCVTGFLPCLTRRGRLAIQEIKIVCKWEKVDLLRGLWYKALLAGVWEAIVDCRCQDVGDLWGRGFACRRWRREETERSCSKSDMHDMHDMWLLRREGCANLPKKLPVLCGKS